jgi:hypothetical protein
LFSSYSSYSSSYSNATTYKIFSLDGIMQKRKKKINYRSSTSIFVSVFSSSFLSLFYNLLPFLATLVFVFLLVEASPFLLDFFLVAIIS